MIKVGVFYPHRDGSKFDMTYYLDRHIPMLRSKLGSALKGVAVEKGLAGGAPGAPMTYVAMAHLLFDSVEAFQTAFQTHAQEIMADIPHYTDLEPIVQISEVKL